MKPSVKNLLIAGIIAASQLVGFNAQARNVNPSATRTTMEVPQSKISSISLNIAAKVIYTQGNATSLVMEGPDNLLPLIVLDNRGGALSINYPKDVNVSSSKKNEVIITITSPTVTALAVAGAGDLEVPSAISVGSLNLAVTGAGDMELKGVTATGNINAAVSGAGDLEMDVRVKAASVTLAVTGAGDLECENLNATSLSATVTGSGDMELKGGNASTAKYALTGAGDLNARKLQATHVTATVSGSGDIICNALTSLNASITSSGDLKYVGAPQITCATRKKPTSVGL